MCRTEGVHFCIYDVLKNHAHLHEFIFAILPFCTRAFLHTFSTTVLTMCTLGRLHTFRFVGVPLCGREVRKI